MEQNHAEKDNANEVYETGKLYRYDGKTFEEIEINNDVRKVPITEEAFNALKNIRANASKVIGMRPEIGIAASAAILAAAELPGISDLIASYGARLYASGQESAE